MVTVHELAVAASINLDNLQAFGDIRPYQWFDEQCGLIRSALEEIAERTCG